LSRGDEPRKVGDILGGVGASLGLGGAVGTGRIWSGWSDIVGGTIADHAEPTSLKDGVLRIRTDSPGWATELGYRGRQIAKRANEIAGAELVTEVRVWTGPGAIERRNRPQEKPSETPTTTASGGRPAPATDEPVEALERARRAGAKRRTGRRD
jgi:hypothetical protein